MPFMFPYPVRRPSGFNGGIAKNPKGLGGSVPPRMPVSSPPVSHQVSRHTDPRAPAPVPTSLVEQSTQHITDISKNLGSGAISSESIALPTTGDIVSMYLSNNLSFVPGATVSGSIQSTTSIEQIFVFNAAGTVIMVILGSQLHMLYEEFSLHTTDFSDPATTVVASTNGTANSVVILPYLRLPASSGSFSMQLYYTGVSNLGSWAANNGPALTVATGINSASVTTGVDVIFGNAEGGTSYISSASVPVQPGINPLQNKVPMQNETIAEMIMYGFAADSDLAYLRIVTNGLTVESYTTSNQLIARDEGRIQATRPTGLFWILPNSQFAMNTSSTFELFLNQTATTTSITVLTYRIG